MRSRMVLALIVVALLLSITSQRKFPTPAFGAHHRPAAYALIFGTVWGPDHRPVYGVKVKIGRAGSRKAKWELISDHNGEFAQRVPPGPADYEIWVEPVRAKHAPALTAEPAKLHIDADERQNVGLHLK